jgi:hypothetical protein
MTISIADLTAAGMTFEAFEAVAVAQQLIEASRGPVDEAQPPYGPPSAGNVFLKEDGSVVCRGCWTTPSVAEVAIFLEALLVPGSPAVPGALRYTIARALLNVDVPPFDSLDAFSRDLSRHEYGDRAVIVRRALARAKRQGLLVPGSRVDRRRSRTSATTLRRELREAEVRLYQRLHQPGQQPDENPAVIDVIAIAPTPLPGRSLDAAAVCLAAGLSLFATGEFIHNRHAAIPGPPPAPPAQLIAAESPRVAPDAPCAEPVCPTVAVASDRAAIAGRDHALRPTVAGASERGIILVRDVAPKPVRAQRADARARRVSVKPAERAATATAGRQAESHPPSRGVLDRLKLGWLRTTFAVRSDEL